MLALIGKLYDVERQAKENELNVSAIKELRQQHSKPILGGKLISNVYPKEGTHDKTD